MTDYDLTYISFGGGVQSTALLAMSALGMRGIPKVDCAVFADTQAELAATYEHIDRMKAWAGERGVPLHVTTAGSLEQDVLVGVGKSHVSIPSFIKTKTTRPCFCRSWEETEDGKDEERGPADPNCAACKGTGELHDEGRGIQRRQCTYDYKVVPIIRRVRELCGLKKGAVAKGVLNVRAMLGISFDEAIRMKPSKEPWITNTFPLVDARLTREDCKKIIADLGIPVPPRSACYFCPHHRDPYWKWMMADHPEEFRKAVEFDAKIRRSQPKLIGEAYLHESLKPLGKVDFVDHQMALEGFGNECEGICGV